jgi:hypothetical protein
MTADSVPRGSLRSAESVRRGNKVEAEVKVESEGGE